MTASITAYEIGVAVHVLAAVCAVGPLVLEPALARRALGGGASDSASLFEAMSWANRVVVTPAFLVLLVAGLYVAGDSGQSLGEPWMSYGFAAVIVVLGVLHAWIAPGLRKAAQLIGAGAEGQEMREVARRLYGGWAVAASLSVIAVVWMSLQAS